MASGDHSGAEVPQVAGGGRYRLLRLLGEGPFGPTYGAEDLRSGERVAVKVLRRLGPAGLDELRRHTGAMLAVSHPNVAKVRELYDDGAERLLITEWIDGIDFISAVRAPAATADHATNTYVGPRTLPFDETRLRALTLDLARGLRALHSAGVLHLGVKPSNVRVTESGAAVLVDYGLDLGGELPPRDAAWYLPPEHGRAPPSATGDWYALGVMLFEALTGRPPFTGPAEEVLRRKRVERPSSPRSLLPGIPADLDALCMVLLDPARELRGTATAVYAALGGGTPGDSGPRLIRDDLAFGHTLVTPTPTKALPGPREESFSDETAVLPQKRTTPSLRTPPHRTPRTQNAPPPPVAEQKVDPDHPWGQRFALRKMLGRGGMGVVFEVEDREQGASVALKTLADIDAQSLLFFKNEFRALADLDHPNLVSLGELICERDQWFFTMELVDGTDFLTYVSGAPLPSAHHVQTRVVTQGDSLVRSQVIREGVSRVVPAAAAMADAVAATVESSSAAVPAFQRPDELKLRAALAQLAEGLAALHGAGKVHRDIKPSNVLVSREGRLVLLDFGLVTETRTALNGQPAFLVGTPFYMAPEQAAMKPLGPPADWYSVGVMLYQALTGRPPYEGTALEIMLAKQEREPPRPSELVGAGGGIAPDLDALCADLLRLDPGARPTAAEVIARLKGAAGKALAISSENVFVGRERELEDLKRAFAVKMPGAATGVFISGESGIGKTALARRFVEQLGAGEQAVLVLAGRCYEREWVPFKALDEVVDALSSVLFDMPEDQLARLVPKDAPLLAKLFPTMGRIPLPAQAAQVDLARIDPIELRNRAFAALRSLLKRLAVEYRVVIFIDDLQWADGDSIALLQDVLAPPNAPPVFLLVTVRTSPGETGFLPAVRDLQEVVRHERQLPLDVLPEDEARRLAEQVGGAPSEIAAAVARETRGHPLLIQELMRAGIGQGLAASARLEEVFAARVAALAPEARRLIEVVSLAAGRLPQQLVAAAAGVEHAELPRQLASLRAARLVRTEGVRRLNRVEPVHDRIREAVLAHVPAEEQRRLHRRLAEVLEPTTDAALIPILVAHLEGAGEVAKAATQAERAADLALEALAFDQAAEMLKAAIRLGQYGPAKRQQMQVAFAGALANAGRGAEAGQAFLEAVAAAEGAERREYQRRAAELLLSSGHLSAGMQVMDDVLTEARERMPKTSRGALMALQAERTRLRWRGFDWTERPARDVSPRQLERVDLFNTILVGLGAVDNARAFLFHTRGVRLALDVGEPTRVCRALSWEGMIITQRGIDAADRGFEHLAHAEDLAAKLKVPDLSALVASCEGIAHYYIGNFNEARERLRDGVRIIEEQTLGTAKLLGTTRLMQLQNLRILGAYDEMARLNAESVRDAVRRGDLFTEVSLARVATILRLVHDEPDEALEDLVRRRWVPPKGRYHVQHWYALRTRAEDHLYRGRPDGQQQMAEELAELKQNGYLRMQIIRAEAHWLAGRLALVAATDATKLDQALADVEVAALALDAERVPYAAIWAQLLRAGAAAIRDEKAAAEALLRGALDASTGYLELTADVAKRALGKRAGGAEGKKLLREAESRLIAVGVADPERFTAMIAPGL